MENSKIRWTDNSWNPMTGCHKISPGCKNCYAFVLAERMRGSKGWPVGFDPMYRSHKLNDPLKWKTPKRIFVNSMSDLFLEEWDIEYLGQIFEVMLQADWHTFQILTKRPEYMRDFVKCYLEIKGMDSLPRHIWLGTSIERDDYVWRADVLREISVPIKFISAEPLLGPLPSLDYTDISWVIVGGESGAGYRPMDHEWAREIRDKCIEGKVAFYFKQSAAIRTEMGQLLDGERWEQYPYE